MANAMRKTLEFLGLAAGEEAQDDYRETVDDFQDDGQYYEEAEEAPVADEREAQVTPISRGHMLRSQAPAVPDLRRIITTHPTTYSDAATIGAAFRAGTPVIINLTDMSDAEAKRMVDFASGLIFGLNGAIERVTQNVFLLSPAHVEIASEERAKPTQPGFYNQS